MTPPPGVEACDIEAFRVVDFLCHLNNLKKQTLLCYQHKAPDDTMDACVVVVTDKAVAAEIATWCSMREGR